MKMQSLLEFNTLLQVYGMTPGRAVAIIPVVLGLVSVITGWFTVARSASRIGYGRLGAIASFATGLIGIILSGTHLIRTTGSGIGTGSGRLGAFVALVLGLVGIVLSGLVLVRSKKKATGDGKEKF